MILLDSSTSLKIVLGEAHNANAFGVVGSYQEIDTDAAIVGRGVISADTNGTTEVTLCAAASSSGYLRKIQGLSLVNTDDVEHTVTLSLDNGTARKYLKVTLAVGDQLTFADDGSWVVRDANGDVAGSGGAGVTDGDKGDVTVSASGATWTIDNDAVTFAKMQNIATDRLIGRDTASSGNAEELTVGGGLEFTGTGGIQRSALTGDVTASAGSDSTTIANDAVTYAKMQNVSATSRILGRKTTGAGDPEECTLSEVLDFVGSPAQGDILYRGPSAWARLGAGTDGYYLKTQGAGANPVWAAVASGGLSYLSIPGLCHRRLTLESGVPVSTSNQSAQSYLYWSPYLSNSVALFDGTTWDIYTPPEIGIAIADPGLSSGAIKDVWGYVKKLTPSSTDTGTDVLTFASAHGIKNGAACTPITSGGGLTAGTWYFARVDSSTTLHLHDTLDHALAGATGTINLTASITSQLVFVSLDFSAAWTNDTTRADALSTKDGAKIKSGDNTLLFLGSIRGSASNQSSMEFSGVASPKMFLSNWYNQVKVSVLRIDTTSTWTSSSASWRQANASSNNQIEVLTCQAETDVRIDLNVVANALGPSDPSFGIGVDSTTPSTNSTLSRVYSGFATCHSKLNHKALGYRVYKWCELPAVSTGSTTVQGENSYGGLVINRSTFSAELTV